MRLQNDTHEHRYYMQSVKKEFEFANDEDWETGKYSLVEYAYMFCSGCLEVVKFRVKQGVDDE